MNRQIARETKLLCPNMAQVTAVRSPSGLNVNSAVLVPAIGCTKSSLIWMSSAGRLWVSVMRPSPIWLLPAQAKTFSGGRALEGGLRVGVELRPGRPCVPLMEVVHLREDVGRGGGDRCRPRDPVFGGLQRNERGERRDDRDEGDQDLQDHRNPPYATPSMRARRAQASTMIIQPTPKRSATMPKRLAKNVVPSGMRTSPRSASAANTRSASASFLALMESEKPSNFGLPWAQPSEAITSSPLMARHECMILLSLPGGTMPGGGGSGLFL